MVGDNYGYPEMLKCRACDGTKLGMAFVTLEDFAKLFTYGVTYDAAAMRRERAPDNEIRVRPVANEGGGTDE